MPSWCGTSRATEEYDHLLSRPPFWRSARLKAPVGCTQDEPAGAGARDS